MKIGFISLPLTGHLNPMTALARQLQSRQHEVVFFGVPDAEPIVRAANLDFVPFGEKDISGQHRQRICCFGDAAWRRGSKIFSS